MTNKFKNASGVHLLQALFYETAIEPNREYVLYTLKQEDHLGYPSIHRLFLECGDPTEYTFATKYFDSWGHWNKIKKCNWFRPYLRDMQEELEVSIRSKALANLIKQRSNGKNAVQVEKYLLDRGWIDKEDKRGRPNKETIKSEAEKLFKDKEDILDDYGRITLNG